MHYDLLSSLGVKITWSADAKAFSRPPPHQRRKVLGTRLNFNALRKSLVHPELCKYPIGIPDKQWQIIMNVPVTLTSLKDHTERLSSLKLGIGQQSIPKRELRSNLNALTAVCALHWLCITVIDLDFLKKLSALQWSFLRENLAETHLLNPGNTFRHRRNG